MTTIKPNCIKCGGPFRYREVHAEDGENANKRWTRAELARYLEGVASTLRFTNSPVAIDLTIVDENALTAYYITTLESSK